MTASKLSMAQIDEALLPLRKLSVTDGQLWQGLLGSLRVSEDTLSTALMNFYGIAVLNDAQWLKVKPLDAAIYALNSNLAMKCRRLFVEERHYLFSEDPWEPDVALAMGRMGQPDLFLALARPGQWSQLMQLPSMQGAAKVVARELASDLQTNASPVVQFVDAAIVNAYREGASDIHFETSREGVGIKYRLDGVMAAGERLDNPQRAEEVISRIKVMAQLDITERRRPQDGRIHWSRAGHDSIDLRVSIMPSIFGEDAVLRLLDKAQLRHAHTSMSLDVLGFDVAIATPIRSLAMRPHGMLLVTGPTGSGKTTTVYAALSEVNDGLEKIITIEDPVEYELPGVLQIPVNEQKGLTFATGLRSILRHDPDKILVGEIRDAETAEIAVQSSLTGHLVFTTVHANSLFDVLGRFHHFGIESFALASAVNGIVVQRLMRRLCSHCVGVRAISNYEAEKLAAFQLPLLATAPVAKGCSNCRQTGYRGRFVVAEVHELTDMVRDLIVGKAPISELRKKLYQDPSQRLFAQAAMKVQQGMTTLEEVARVVGLA